MGGLRDEGERRTGEALLGAEEVAEYFGVTKTTIYRWCKEGRVPCLKVGKFWRMRRGALEHLPKKPERGRPSGMRTSETLNARGSENTAPPGSG